MKGISFEKGLTDAKGKEAVGKDEKTLINKLFDRQFESTELQMFYIEFTDGEGLNARGRNHLRLIISLFSLLFFLDGDDNAIYFELALFFAFIITLPAAINKISPIAIKMIDDKNNLYDILSAFGTYFLITAAVGTTEYVFLRAIFALDMSKNCFMRYVLPAEIFISFAVIALDLMRERRANSALPKR